MASPQRKPIVGWYDPRQLAQTAVEVAISTIFGRHSDHRLVEAMASGDDERRPYDYSYHYIDDGKEDVRPNPKDSRTSIWFDYVGDVGDGWDSTYAVAYYLAQPSGLKVLQKDYTSGTAQEIETARGEILIFGGDEVYPTASRQEYNDRLIAPYATALRHSSEAAPHVFAIPGNHDWYDSLVAFTRVFTAKRWFGGWRTRQSRSYFALKLPHNWWLLGTDLQLGSDIDRPQMDYFINVSSLMDQELRRSGIPPRIILCHAEPHWLRAAQYGGWDPNYNESNLKVLERRLGKHIAVYIAGDLHYYRRHESTDQSTQKITSGGGGAFLHPTHTGRVGGERLDLLTEYGLSHEERRFEQRACFPPVKESRRLTWRNLGFPIFRLTKNESWTFGLATAGLYLLLTMSTGLRVTDPSFISIWPWSLYNVIGVALESLFRNPLTLLMAALTFVGFLFFTDTHKKLHRFIGGGVHAIAHILMAFWVALISVYYAGNYLPTDTWPIRFSWPTFEIHIDGRIFVVWLIIFALSYFVGSFIMGLYLLISLNLFGRHGNEAFSSLGIDDWKHFLRLHINEEGDLTIYPIGIKKIPRKWKPREESSGPELVPNDPRATKPELIEHPIVLKSAPTETHVRAVAPPEESATELKGEDDR